MHIGSLCLFSCFFFSPLRIVVVRWPRCGGGGRGSSRSVASPWRSARSESNASVTLMTHSDSAQSVLARLLAQRCLCCCLAVNEFCIKLQLRLLLFFSFPFPLPTQCLKKLFDCVLFMYRCQRFMIPSVTSCLCCSICDPTDVVVASCFYHHGRFQEGLRSKLW